MGILYFGCDLLALILQRRLAPAPIRDTIGEFCTLARNSPAQVLQGGRSGETMRPLGFPNGRMVSRDRPPYEILTASLLASMQIEAPQGSEAEEKRNPPMP